MPMDQDRRKTPYWVCLLHDLRFDNPDDFAHHFDIDPDHIKERQGEDPNKEKLGEDDKPWWDHWKPESAYPEAKSTKKYD